jgi:hypothetical protein
MGTIKAELVFQKDQAVALFDGVGQSLVEVLVLASIAVPMICGILGVLGGLGYFVGSF